MARSTNVPENLLFITDRPYLTEALYESIVINYTRNKAFMRHFIKKLHCFIYPFHLTISTDQGVVLRNTGHSTLAHHHTKYFCFFFASSICPRETNPFISELYATTSGTQPTLFIFPSNPSASVILPTLQRLFTIVL